MQSSPPARAWERPASPTGESQYSLDLEAFDETEPRSGASSPLPDRHVDQVLSEDIDGPSDFTLNMEKWMRGGTWRKGAAADVLPTLNEHGQEDADDEMDNALSELHTSTPKKEIPPVGEEEHSASGHTPSNSPPKESVFGQHSNVVDGPDDGLAASRTSTPDQPSSPATSPIPQRSSQRQFSSQTDEASFDHRLQQLEAKCQQLEHQNSALNQALDEERRIRKREAAVHEAQLADASKREHDLMEMKDQTYSLKEKLENESGNAENMRRQPEVEQTHEQRTTEDSEDAHAAGLRTLREEMEREKLKFDQETRASTKQMEQERSEHSEAIAALKRDLAAADAQHSHQVRMLQQDLELARRNREDAEETARRNSAELEEVRDAHDTEMDRMRIQLQQTSDLRSHVAELEEQLATAGSEKQDLQGRTKAAEDANANLRAEISIIKQTQDEQTTRLTTDHRRAVDLAGDLQGKLKEMRQQLRDQQTAHDAEMERQQNESHRRPRSPSASSAQELDSLRSDLDAMQSKLNSAVLERDETQDALQSVQSELEASKRELHVAQIDLADLQAVNVALDSRISDALRKRETYWRARLEDVEKERRVMAKALFRQWGREEVGIEEPLQGYVYQYVGKSKTDRLHNGTKSGG